MLDIFNFDESNYDEIQHRLIIPASALGWIGNLFNEPTRAIRIMDIELPFSSWDGRAWTYCSKEFNRTVMIDVVNDLDVWTSEGWKPLEPDVYGRVKW